MQITASNTTSSPSYTPASTGAAPRTAYNPVATASAGTGLLLSAEGYSAAGSASALFGDLGYAQTSPSTAASAPAKGSVFNPAAASETGASELFSYEGFPSTTATTSLFGSSSSSTATTAVDYGIGQYASISALLNAGFSSNASTSSGGNGGLLWVSA
jgi:hypothetical protein